MTDCSTQPDLFPACKSRKVQADFEGGDITSDGGSLLLRQVDRRIGLTRAVDRALGDSRRQASCDHQQLHLLRQRTYGLALGYEDLNDHQTMRHDLALQTSVDVDKELASASTLCRFENRADRATAVAIHRVLIEKFIESFDEPPTRCARIKRYRSTPPE